MNTLLAVDGSDHAYEAVRALKYFAKADRLMVLHALDVPRPAYPMMVPEVTEHLYRELENGMREEGERLLDRILSLLPPQSGPATKVLRTGSPAEVIITTAEEERIDLIVMGARGLGPIKERILGSVSHRVLTSAPCAKLIVNGPMRALREVLLPLSGSFDTEEALRFLQSKPFREPVDLTLLTVLPSVRPPWPLAAAAAETLEQRELESARQFLEHTATRLHALGYQARSQVLLGMPVESILTHAQKHKADLILMGSRGRQGVSRFLLGSVSHAVLHQAPCPLLVFR
jgi:nucleotide-binding universal stress UspA family protein